MQKIKLKSILLCSMMCLVIACCKDKDEKLPQPNNIGGNYGNASLQHLWKIQYSVRIESIDQNLGDGEETDSTNSTLLCAKGLFVKFEKENLFQIDSCKENPEVYAYTFQNNMIVEELQDRNDTLYVKKLTDKELVLQAYMTGTNIRFPIPIRHYLKKVE